MYVGALDVERLRVGRVGVCEVGHVGGLHCGIGFLDVVCLRVGS